MTTWFFRHRLTWAIHRHNEAAARAALKAGASAHIPDSTGYTPLHIAVRCQCLPIVRLLLDLGADVFASTPSGETAVEMALRNADFTMVLLLSAAVKAQTHEGTVSSFSDFELSEPVYC